MPRLSLEISIGGRSLQIQGLVDTGASVNVLPYQFGLALGADWDRQSGLGTLTGGMAGIESRALAVTGHSREIAGAMSVPLLFAWAQSETAPILFGQTNFLSEFSVCFYRSQKTFEVWRND